MAKTVLLLLFPPLLVFLVNFYLVMEQVLKITFLCQDIMLRSASSHPLIQDERIQK